MASPPFYKHASQVSASSFVLPQSNPYPYDKIRRCSKGQMRLNKIIDIITSSCCDFSKGSSVPVNRQSNRSESEAGSSKVTVRDSVSGLEIDLNLRLGPPQEIGEAEKLAVADHGLSACSGVGDVNQEVRGIVCSSLTESGDVSTVEKSSEGECDPKEVENLGKKVEKLEREEEQEQEQEEDEDDNDVLLGEEETEKGERREFSEITNLQEKSSRNCENKKKQAGQEDQSEAEEGEEEADKQKEKEEGEEENSESKKEKRQDGYLGLLLDAMLHVFGNLEGKPSSPGNDAILAEKSTKTETEPITNCRSKRKPCWMLDFYEDFENTAPLVKSKRGRNQVLPYRYRDSALEPWKRLPRQKSRR